MKQAVTLTCCVLLAVAAAPAEAKKKHKKKSGLGPVVTVTATGNNTTGSTQESSATATCPSGKQAFGGGFSAPLNNVVGALLPHDSYRSSPQSWTAAARNIGGIGAVTVYAYCRNTTKSAISDVAQATTFTSGGETQTIPAACPAGTQLVGGGFQSTAGPSSSDLVILQVNAPGAFGGWTVTGINNTSADHSLITHAYCLAGIKTPTIVSASNNAFLGSYGVLTASTATCPAPKKGKKGKKGKKKGKKKPRQLLSAGGFTGPVFAGTGPVLLYSDNRVGTSGGWTASGTNFGANGSRDLTVQGLCV